MAAGQFKVVLLGEGCVGKTSLVLRYCQNVFNDKHITTLQVPPAHPLPPPRLREQPHTSAHALLLCPRTGAARHAPVRHRWRATASPARTPLVLPDLRLPQESARRALALRHPFLLLSPVPPPPPRRRPCDPTRLPFPTAAPAPRGHSARVRRRQASFLKKRMNIGGKRVDLSIWVRADPRARTPCGLPMRRWQDTAGQERFHALGCAAGASRTPRASSPVWYGRTGRSTTATARVRCLSTTSPMRTRSTR